MTEDRAKRHPVSITADRISSRADRLRHSNGVRKARFIAVHKILSRKEQANGQ